ncbi:MAG: SLC13 family permease [Bacillota bacterium]
MSTETVKVSNTNPSLFEGLNQKQLIGLFLGFGLMFLLHFGPALPGLKPQAQSILGVFLWFMVIMIFNSLHKFVVGLLAPGFAVMLGGFKIPEAFSAFSSDAFFLTAGAFTFAAIMMGTPLGKRIAITITDVFRSVKVTRIFFGLSAADFAISGFLPTVAETGLLLPLAKGFSSLMKGKEDDPEVQRINKGLFLLICGLMPLFTSMIILTAHFPNILMAGFLEEAVKIKVTWMDWLVLNIPLWGLMPVAFFYTVWYYKLWNVEIPGAADELPKMKADLGPTTWSEKWALGALLICVVLWITEGKLHSFSTGMVSLILVLLVFLPFSRIKYSQIGPHIMWDTWILLGGAISMGTALHKSGAIQWLVDLIMAPMGDALYTLPPIIVLILVVIGTQIARAGLVSAAAMGAMFIPLCITLAPTLGFNVLPFTMIVVNSLSYSFFLPMSITAFFIAWGAVDMSMGEVIKFGAPLSIICNIYTVLTMSVWLPLMGYPLMM